MAAGTLVLTVEFGEDSAVPIDPANPAGCKQVEARPRFRLTPQGSPFGPVAIAIGSVDVGADSKVAAVVLTGLAPPAPALDSILSGLRTQIAAHCQAEVADLKQQNPRPAKTTVFVHGFSARIVENNVVHLLGEFMPIVDVEPHSIVTFEVVVPSPPIWRAAQSRETGFSSWAAACPMTSPSSSI